MTPSTHREMKMKMKTKWILNRTRSINQKIQPPSAMLMLTRATYSSLLLQPPKSNLSYNPSIPVTLSLSSSSTATSTSLSPSIPPSATAPTSFSSSLARRYLTSHLDTTHRLHSLQHPLLPFGPNHALNSSHNTHKLHQVTHNYISHIHTHRHTHTHLHWQVTEMQRKKVWLIEMFWCIALFSSLLNVCCCCCC